MEKLVKFQLRNMFHQKFYYVCLFLFIFMYPVLDFISVFNTQNYESIKVLPEIVDNLSGGGSIISIIFIALFCCLDFNEETAKNIIGRGYSKIKLLFSKYIVSLVGIFSFYIISFVVIFCLFGVNGLGYQNDMLFLIINSCVRIIAYVVMYSTMSFVLEKNSFSILACLFIPSIIQTVLSLIDSNLHIKASQFWIDNVSMKFLNKPSLTNLSYSIVYIIYIILFIVLGISLVKKKEIK